MLTVPELKALAVRIGLSVSGRHAVSRDTILTCFENATAAAGLDARVCASPAPPTPFRTQAALRSLQHVFVNLSSAVLVFASRTSWHVAFLPVYRTIG